MICLDLQWSAQLSGRQCWDRTWHHPVGCQPRSTTAEEPEQSERCNSQLLAQTYPDSASVSWNSSNVVLVSKSTPVNTIFIASICFIFNSILKVPNVPIMCQSCEETNLKVQLQLGKMFKSGNDTENLKNSAIKSEMSTAKHLPCIHLWPDHECHPAT